VQVWMRLVLIQLVLLVMDTWLPETRREINIHEKELSIKLVIYNDVRVYYIKIYYCAFVGCNKNKRYTVHAFKYFRKIGD
jgi:hypothetical protein